MRALIAGIVFVGGVCTACTPCSSCGTARYSGDSAPAPTVARRNVPVWPTSTPAPVVAYAPSPTPVPSYVPPRTVAPQPIVLSSRPAPSPSAAPTSIAPRSVATLPPPASRARTASELAAALRPINATCPVMLGTPVDLSVTASYQGRVVAFSDTHSRSLWLSEPSRYASNLPGTAGFGSASDGPVYASAPAAPSADVNASVYAPLPPAAMHRPVYAAPEAAPAYPQAPPSAPAAVLAPSPRPVPVPVATRPAAPAPAPAPAAEDDETGGVCTGGNCALPTRRK